MNISAAKQLNLPAILKVSFSADLINFYLSDGRVLSVPIAWFPTFSEATKDQLENYEISPSGYGIHWPDLDEDLSVLGLLFHGKA